MDVAGQNVIGFLSNLQHRRDQLVELWKILSAQGSYPHRPYLTLSGSPFRIHEAERIRVFDGSIALGIGVRGTDNKEYDLGIDVLWTEAGWTITTEVWVENEGEGQTLLDKLPERSSIEILDCIEQMQNAIIVCSASKTWFQASIKNHDMNVMANQYGHQRVPPCGTESCSWSK